MKTAFDAHADDGWKALLLRGALAILFGLAALFLPDMTLAALMTLFAACLAFGGALAILAGARIARRGGRAAPFYVEGALAIAVAALAALWPDHAIAAIIAIIGIWTVLMGGLLLFAARRLRAGAPGEWVMALPGVLAGAFGVVLIFWPSIAAVAFSWWLGLFAILFGAILSGAAWRLRNRSRLARIVARME